MGNECDVYVQLCLIVGMQGHVQIRKVQKQQNTYIDRELQCKKCSGNVVPIAMLFCLSVIGDTVN